MLCSNLQARYLPPSIARLLLPWIFLAQFSDCFKHPICWCRRFPVGILFFSQIGSVYLARHNRGYWHRPVAAKYRRSKLSNFILYRSNFAVPPFASFMNNISNGLVWVKRYLFLLAQKSVKASSRLSG